MHVLVKLLFLNSAVRFTTHILYDIEEIRVGALIRIQAYGRKRHCIVTAILKTIDDINLKMATKRDAATRYPISCIELIEGYMRVVDTEIIESVLLSDRLFSFGKIVDELVTDTPTSQNTDTPTAQSDILDRQSFFSDELLENFTEKSSLKYTVKDKIDFSDVTDIRENNLSISRYTSCQQMLSSVLERANRKSLFFILCADSTTKKILLNNRELTGRILYGTRGLIYLNETVYRNRIDKYTDLFLIEDFIYRDSFTEKLCETIIRYNTRLYHKHVTIMRCMRRDYDVKFDRRNLTPANISTLIPNARAKDLGIKIYYDGVHEMMSYLRRDSRYMIFYPTYSFLSHGKKREYMLFCAACRCSIKCPSCVISYLDIYLTHATSKGYVCVCNRCGRSSLINSLFCTVCKGRQTLAVPTVLGLIKFLKNHNYSAKNKIDANSSSYVYVVSNIDVLLRRVKPEQYDYFLLTGGLYDGRRFRLEDRGAVSYMANNYRKFFAKGVNYRTTKSVREMLTLDALFGEKDIDTSIYKIYSKSFSAMRTLIKSVFTKDSFTASDLQIHRSADIENSYNYSVYVLSKAQSNLLNKLSRAQTIYNLDGEIAFTEDLQYSIRYPSNIANIRYENIKNNLATKTVVRYTDLVKLIF